jgi:hypothetical protein
MLPIGHNPEHVCALCQGHLLGDVPSNAQHGAYAPARLDGRASGHSTPLPGPRWVHRTEADGQVHGRQPVGSAPLVNAGAPRVLPLAVAAGRNSDGQTTQAGAIHAATRLRPRLRHAPPRCRGWSVAMLSRATSPALPRGTRGVSRRGWGGRRPRIPHSLRGAWR